MDITCQDNKCLICDSTLEYRVHDYIALKCCVNGCTQLILKGGRLMYFHFYGAECKEEDIITQVNYWKKDGRYLVKLMEGDVFLGDYLS